MANFLIFSFLFCAIGFATTLGQEAGGAIGNVDKLSIAQFIDDVAAKAREGVAASLLRESMVTFSLMVDSYLNDRNAKVNVQEIVDVLGEITSENNWIMTLSNFLEDPMVQEGRKVSAGLFVLTELSKRIKTTANETELNVLFAAASFTAESVRRSIANAEDIFTFTKEDVDKTPAKRWEVNGNVGHTPQGTSWNIGFSHQWSGRSLVARGQWSVGGNIGHGPGGWSGGASLSYSWG